MFVTNFYNFLVFMQYIEVFPTGLCFGNGRAKSSFKYEFLFIFLKHNCFCALAAWQVGGGGEGSGAEDRDMSAQRWRGAEQRGTSAGSEASQGASLRQQPPFCNAGQCLNHPGKRPWASTLREQFQNQSGHFQAAGQYIQVCEGSWDTPGHQFRESSRSLPIN